MNIEKLPSGSYRIRQSEDGKRYSMTVPYRPTQKEAIDLIYDKIGRKSEMCMTFEAAAGEYIHIKNDVLSPSTVRGYNAYLRNLPDWFKAMDIAQIDDYHLQKLISDFSHDHSPKSTSNVYGFIRAVIRLFCPKTDISATLPQKRLTEHYTPSTDDVKRLLELADKTPFYIPIHLAILSLRRSEICALTIDDLKGNRLTVNKSLVLSDNGFVLKPTPKTDASYRTITLPPDLADRIRAQGYIYNLKPNSIDQWIRRHLPELGIPQFSLHKLRHFFASYAHDLGYSDAQIQKMGGWSTDNVMKSVYRHAMDLDEAALQMAEDFSF